MARNRNLLPETGENRNQTLGKTLTTARVRDRRLPPGVDDETFGEGSSTGGKREYQRRVGGGGGGGEEGGDGDGGGQRDSGCEDAAVGLGCSYLRTPALFWAETAGPSSLHFPL